MWCFTILVAMPSCAAISLLTSPRARSPSTSASRSVKLAGSCARGASCPAAASTCPTASRHSRPSLASRPSCCAAASAERASRCGRFDVSATQQSAAAKIRLLRSMASPRALR